MAGMNHFRIFHKQEILCKRSIIALHHGIGSRWRYPCAMKRIRALRVLLVALSVVIAGCVTQSVVIEPNAEPATVVPEVPVNQHYEPVANRSPEVIAALRAAPAPAQPEIVDGQTFLGDQHTLGARGYVHIGNGHYEIADASAQQKAIELGKEIGADRIVIYRAFRPDTDTQAPATFLAAYYVRFKLLFGATFRNLTAKEREKLEGNSGVQIGSVVGGTPASQANLMAGDFVLGFNGRPFKDRTEFMDLLRSQAGKPVTLSIRRGEVTMDRVVRLGAMPVGSGER
jgi:membrane-associated protease RseP (regulator of RpoE activity)